MNAIFVFYFCNNFHVNSWKKSTSVLLKKVEILTGGAKLLFHGTLDFFTSNLGFCLELGLLNSETEIGTGVA